MALPYVFNSISDVNAIDIWTNLDPSIRDRVKPELFYSKQLLDTLRIDPKHYVYFRLADSVPIEGKADKLILRRWTPLKAHTIPLSEGIPPGSDRGAVMKYEISAKQYGRYMEFTDLVDFQAVDPVIANYSKEYSIVAMETLDMLAQKALMSYCSQTFAGGVTGFADIVATSGSPAAYPDMAPKLQDLINITLAMKKALVKPRANGRFQVIGSPEFMADMINDPIVKDYMGYNNTTKTMYDDGKLVPLFGMEFYETMCCPTTGLFVDSAGATKSLKVCIEIDGGNAVGKGAVSGALTGSGAHYLKEDIGTKSMNDPLNGENFEDTSYIPSNTSKDDINSYNYEMASGLGAKWAEYKVQHILVIGDKALVRTGLSGQDQAKMYVKPLGSSGVLDPINQRQSIGFKINSVGFAVIESRAVTDYICVPKSLIQEQDLVA